MRKHLLTLLLTCITVFGFAQSADLALVDIRMNGTSSNDVPPGMESPVELVIVNIDSNTASEGDSIYLLVDIAGEVSFTMNLFLEEDLEQNDTLIYPLGSNHYFTYPDSNGVSITASALINSAADTNFANNAVSKQYTTNSSIDDDWSCTEVEVVAPGNLDGFDIDNGTNIPPILSEVHITLNNEGTVHYLQGTMIRYMIYLGNDTTTINTALHTSEVSPGSSTNRVITNTSILPAVPDSVGSYALCARPIMMYDGNNANDEGCFDFEIIDNFDPTDPANWPFGLEEVEGSTTLTFARSWMTVSGDESTYRLSLFDLSGKEVAGMVVENGVQIPLPSLANGLYVVRVHQTDGTVLMTEKIIVQ